MQNYIIYFFPLIISLCKRALTFVSQKAIQGWSVVLGIKINLWKSSYPNYDNIQVDEGYKLGSEKLTRAFGSGELKTFLCQKITKIFKFFYLQSIYKYHGFLTMSDTDFTDTQITMSLLIPPTWNLLLNGISPLCPPLKYTKYISSHFLIIINSSSVSLLSPFTFVTTFIMGFKQFTWFWKYWQHININGINLTQVQINSVHVLIFDIYLNFMHGH